MWADAEIQGRAHALICKSAPNTRVHTRAPPALLCLSMELGGQAPCLVPYSSPRAAGVYGKAWWVTHTRPGTSRCCVGAELTAQRRNLSQNGRCPVCGAQGRAVPGLRPYSEAEPQDTASVHRFTTNHITSRCPWAVGGRAAPPHPSIPAWKHAKQSPHFHHQADRKPGDAAHSSPTCKATTVHARVGPRLPVHTGDTGGPACSSC